MPFSTPQRVAVAGWVLTALALFLTLYLHLLPALLAGLLVYELVHRIAPRLVFFRVRASRGRLVAVGILAVIVVAALTLAVFGAVAFFRSDSGSLSTLLAKMADILDSARDKLPADMADRLPDNAEEVKNFAVEWLRSHAGELQLMGKDVVIAFVHVIVGMVIGGMISLREAAPGSTLGPLATVLVERAARLGDAFRRIVFAQLRISALNTTLTAIYLVGVLPALGIHLPLQKTMIAVTFIAGLLPVVGNLISNTVIVVVSLSNSLGAAVGSLAYLVVIHKLEYFVNARIVGAQIRARAWELLLAMLTMEAAFGIPGLVAAPIYYAYVKDELSRRKLI